MKTAFSLYLLCILFSMLNMQAFAGEDDLYKFHWLDASKKVFVLQNKIFEKENTIYINGSYGTNTTSQYQDSSIIGTSVGYFWKERWGVELLYQKFTNTDNAPLDYLSANDMTIPFIRRLTQKISALILYSPFYAKINTYNKIYYLEWLFGIGYSSISAESNISDFRKSDPRVRYEIEAFGGITVKTQFRLYLSEMFTLNLDLMKTYYSAISGVSDSATLQSQDDMYFSFGINF